MLIQMIKLAASTKGGANVNRVRYKSVQRALREVPKSLWSQISEAEEEVIAILMTLLSG
jgi:hypothetical protein